MATVEERVATVEEIRCPPIPGPKRTNNSRLDTLIILGKSPVTRRKMFGDSRKGKMKG